MDEGSCEKCDGTGRKFNGETYELCECKIKQRLKRYLQRLGHVEPANGLTNKLKHTLDKPLQDYYVQVGSLPVCELNGLIAYMLRSVFPREYQVKNVYELHTELRDSDQFGDVLQYRDPLCILTAGLEEEFEGYTQEGEKWTTGAYSKTAIQVISNRQRFNLPSWVFERGGEYRSLRQHCRDKGFEMINCGSSDNSSVKSI